MHRQSRAARADDRKFDLSSIVVNEAPSGMLAPQPMAAHVSARAITAGANRKPVPAMRLSVTSMCPRRGRARRGRTRSRAGRDERRELRRATSLCLRRLLTGSAATAGDPLPVRRCLKILPLSSRQLGDEVDLPRALEVREVGAAVRDQLGASSSVGSTPSTSCTTERTSSPQSSCGMPIVAASRDGGVREQHRVDLPRVDVHAAGDDQVRGAVGEEEEAVVVEVAHVAEGEVLASVGAVGLGVVLEVAEAIVRGRLEPHEPDLAGGQRRRSPRRRPSPARAGWACRPFRAS